jgi:hypothetical protein
MACLALLVIGNVANETTGNAAYMGSDKPGIKKKRIGLLPLFTSAYLR